MVPSADPFKTFRFSLYVVPAPKEFRTIERSGDSVITRVRPGEKNEFFHSTIAALRRMEYGVVRFVGPVGRVREQKESDSSEVGRRSRDGLSMGGLQWLGHIELPRSAKMA